MTQISKEEIEKLAALARIDLTDKEVETFHKGMASILDFVSQVQEVSEKSTKTDFPTGVWALIKNKFREDKDPHPSGSYTEEILREAPQREGDYFKVKKIL